MLLPDDALPADLHKRALIAAGFVGLDLDDYTAACVAGGLEIHRQHDEYLDLALRALEIDDVPDAA